MPRHRAAAGEFLVNVEHGLGDHRPRGSGDDLDRRHVGRAVVIEVEEDAERVVERLAEAVRGNVLRAGVELDHRVFAARHVGLGVRDVAEFEIHIGATAVRVHVRSEA